MRFKIRFGLNLLFLHVATFAPALAFATAYSVPCASGGTGSDVLDLNSAINTAADSGTPPNTVTLAAGCDYKLPSSALGYFAAPDGSPSFFQNISNDVTIVGNGATIEFASGNSPPRRFFFVMPNGTLTLKQLTLKGGIAHGENGGDAQAAAPGAGGTYSGLGGAIYNTGNLVVELVTFDSNQAIGGNGGAGRNGSNGGGGGGGLGGAIFNTGSFDIQRSTFRANAANGGAIGGGAGCLDSNCYSNAGGGGGAGGIGGGYTPTGSVPGNGSYGGGGGGFPFGSGPAASGGFAGGGGGGFFVGGAAGEFGGTGAVYGFSGGGGGGLGGAVFVEITSNTTSRIVNSTFSANSVAGGGSGSNPNGDGNGGSGAGGAIFLRQGTMALRFSTLIGNSASGGSVQPANPQSGGNATGGGIYVHSGSTLNMDHTIVSGGSVTAGTTSNGSAGSATDADVSGALGSSGFNIVNVRGSSSGYVGSDLADGTAPVLGALQNNGGSTLTFLPLPGSPAIDADTSAGCNQGYANDQRGAPRPFGAGCDIGAVEVGDTIFRNGFEVP